MTHPRLSFHGQKRKADRLNWTKAVEGAIGAAEKPKVKRPSKASEPEHNIQVRAENLCDALGVRWFRIPDNLLAYLYNFAPPRIRAFVAKYFKGVPDMMLFKKSGSGDNMARLIEIKTEVGKVSTSQEKWHRGLDVRVCYGWEQTEKEIREFAA